MTGNVRFVPPPAGAVNAFVAASAARPNSGRRLFPDDGSVISNVSVPLRGFADALFTTTLISALSPSRRNLGTYGRTMRSLTVFVSASTAPPRRSFVTAWTNTLHDVTESGT